MKGHEGHATENLIYKELYICWDCRVYGPHEQFAPNPE